MIIDNELYNHHPEQTGIWFKYNGWRYKEYYDVKKYDGTIVKKCYPNGSGFHNSEQRVPEEDVEFVRLTDYSDTYLYKGMSRQAAIEYIVNNNPIEAMPLKTIDHLGNVTYVPRIKES